jgi:hypothetical protein
MKCLKFAVFATLLLLCAGGVWAFEIEPASIAMTTETIASPGNAQVTIKAIPREAVISVDGGNPSANGWKGTLSEGDHVISATAADHYPAQFNVTLKENTRYAISLRLEPHTGFLALEIEPAEAEVIIDGQKVIGAMVEVPVGRHSVIVRKFGYDQQSSFVQILWQRTSTLKLSLSPSVFELSSWGSKPDLFNPANRGAYGRVMLSFTVTAPGFGSLEVLDDQGKKVRYIELPAFKTWSQKFAWDGRNDAGARIPDGEYEIRLFLWQGARTELTQNATPAQGSLQSAPLQEAEPAFATKVRLDSSFVIAPFGNAMARPGLSFLPIPKALEMLPSSAEVLFAYPLGASMNVGFGIGSSTRIAVEGIMDAEDGFGISGSLVQEVAKIKGFMDLGIMGRVAWNSETPAAGAVLRPGLESVAEIAVPASLDLGALGVGISPGAVFGFASQSIAGRLGAGLWYESQALVAGISAQTDMGAGALLSTENPLYAALDFRFLFNRLPLTAGLRLSGALAPGLEAMTAALAFGFAW